MQHCNTEKSITAANGYPGSIFSKAFGVTFEFSPHLADEVPVCARVDCDRNCECRDGIFIEAAGQHTWNLRVSGVPVKEEAVDASAVVEALNREAVVRSARCALHQLEQQTTIDYLNQQLRFFLEQVSGDLEEACWFRVMADHVAACRADDPLELLCQRIMPQLRSLLHAESLLLVQDQETEDGHFSADEIVAIESDLPSHDDARCSAIDLVNRLREQATENAIVINTRFSTGQSQEIKLPPSIDEMVLVRVGTEAQHFGWLIALGRCHSKGAEDGLSSESEFGTHEATLMETAAVMLATHAANCDLFDEQEKTLVGVVKAMVNALDARDSYTRGHSDRVARIGKRIAEELKLSETECEDIHLSGLLHDIGKIGVPDHVLLKNGPLDQSERDQIEQHPVTGHAILSPVSQLGKILPGVLHHHERVDGTGYPEKLLGGTIPMSGRILAVADAYDAMTTCRPYRNAMPASKAERILREGAGTQWDEVVIDAFFAAIVDIQTVYAQVETAEETPIQQESLLQFGRFEDESLGISESLLQCDLVGG